MYKGFVKYNMGTDHSKSKMEGFGEETSNGGTYEGMYVEN